MRTLDSFIRMQRGLTLIELVVAMAVAGILLAAGYGIFLTQQKTYAVQDQVAEIQQNARVAMNMLARDVRMAGHGVPMWDVSIGGTTYSDTVTAVGSTMTLLGCFGAPEGYLRTSAGKEATQIVLVDSDQASKFDTGDRGYVFIGEYDKAIIDTISGNALTIDTDPALDGNQGLRKRYPTARLDGAVEAGANQISVDNTNNIQVGDILTLGDERLYVTGITPTTIEFDTDPTTPLTRDPLQEGYQSLTLVNPIPVYRVQALQYALTNGRITREDLADGGAVRLAENIQSFTITPQIANNPTYDIEITARTDVPDDAGRFPGRAYDFTVRVRNPL